MESLGLPIMALDLIVGWMDHPDFVLTGHITGNSKAKKELQGQEGFAR